MCHGALSMRRVLIEPQVRDHGLPEAGIRAGSCRQDAPRHGDGDAVPRERCGLEVFGGEDHLGETLAALDHRIYVFGLVDQIEEHQIVLALEGFAQGAFDVARLVHPQADVSVGFGQLGESGSESM